MMPPMICQERYIVQLCTLLSISNTYSQVWFSTNICPLGQYNSSLVGNIVSNNCCLYLEAIYRSRHIRHQNLRQLYILLCRVFLFSICILVPAGSYLGVIYSAAITPLYACIHRKTAKIDPTRRIISMRANPAYVALISSCNPPYRSDSYPHYRPYSTLTISQDQGAISILSFPTLYVNRSF